MKRLGPGVLLAASQVLGLSASVLAGEEPAPSLAIVEPVEDAFVSGAITLKAQVEPAALPVVRVVFTADGAAGLLARDAALRVCLGRRAGGRAPPSARGGDPAAGRTAGGERAHEGGGVRARGGRGRGAGRGHRHRQGGKFVRGLGKDAFHVFEDGVEQPVTHLIGEGTAREVVIAVDMSGSMADAMPVCREAVKAFLAPCGPTTR